MELVFFLVLIGSVFLHLYLKSPTVIGAAGERRVNSILRGKLDEQTYVILDDLTLPTEKGTTQIDHIVLSRYGIFVVETKNMSGWIFGSRDQARWTQVMRRHKSQFQNPLRQNYHHLKVVQGILDLKMGRIENLVVFIGSAIPKTTMPPNVFWSGRDLVSHIASRQSAMFTDTELREFTKLLRQASLEQNRETKRAHVQHVKSKAIERSSDKTKCPRCGANMVERTNRKTNQTFLGCSRFPKCRGTRR